MPLCFLQGKKGEDDMSPYARPCKRCGEKYKPTTKQNRMCRRCKQILHIRDRIAIVTKSLEEIRRRIDEIK
jgi:uncharacterized OB-fold protein